MLTGYEQVKTIVIARDAENNSTAAVDNVKCSLQLAALPVPNNPFEYVGNSLRVAFMIFPGYENQTLTVGTLEDLCLEIIKDRSLIRGLAEAKGLPKRVGEQQAVNFFK
ncbi:MAG: hypothetical protein PHN84_12115 [Desulfuromonadaceae bacterium]|nr:hypothetical protein [Desulfuromonadaceae bacterium]MDD2856711.1 hypothetical protein [Desulfuromonadaceae bacterium]